MMHVQSYSLSIVEKYNSRNKNIRATLNQLVQAQSGAADDLS